MASDTDVNIAEGMFNALSEFAEDHSPALPVAWPNKAFTAPTSGGYLSASFLPAQTFGFGVGGASSNQHRGIFQASVFWPENRMLPGALAIAGEIVTHFAKHSRIERAGTSILISDSPWISPHLAEPKWIQVPVNVPYFVGAP